MSTSTYPVVASSVESKVTVKLSPVSPTVCSIGAIDPTEVVTLKLSLIPTAIAGVVNSPTAVLKADGAVIGTSVLVSSIIFPTLVCIPSSKDNPTTSLGAIAPTSVDKLKLSKPTSWSDPSLTSNKP